MASATPISPRQLLRAGLAATAASLLASCATPPWQAPGPTPGPTESETRPSEKPGRLKPMPVRTLDIRQADVRHFSATVDIPRRGSCRFDGPFTQTRRLPSVELRAKDGCTVNIWEQGHQVTVGFSDCARRCSRGTFDYVWPIIVDRTSGQCH